MARTFIKDPDAALDYVVDWSEWLPDGDTISASAWSASAGLTVDDDSQFTTTRATIWISGGEAGSTYHLTNHITTADAREDDRTITIQVWDR